MKSSFRAISGFIQAGGHSSRMGTDKAWINIDGLYMIERVINATVDYVDSLAIVINPTNPNIEKYNELSIGKNLSLIYDIHDHRGPLGGIHTALKEISDDKSALILACDLPYITKPFIQFLIDVHLKENYDLTLPEDSNARLQPLAGIYSHNCLSHVEQMLAENILRVDRLCDKVKTRRIEFKEYSHLENSSRILTNVNRINDIA